MRIAETNIQGLLVLNPDDSVVFINTPAEQILGVQSDDVTGRNLWDVPLAPEILIRLTSNGTEDLHRFVVDENTILMQRERLPEGAGTIGTIWTVQSVPTETNHNPCDRDSVERDTVEQELNAIIESVSDGIYVTDGAGVTLRVNSAFQRITGIRADDVVGKHVEQLVKRDIFRKSVTISVLEKRKPVSMVETLKIGKEVLLTGIPIFDDEHEIFRVVTTLRDIDGLNALREQLAASKEKTKLYEKELFQLRLQQLDMENIVINSRVMREVVQMAMRLGEVNSNVLITGESGVGKDIVAKIIHKSGFGENAPIIACNCGAIPESLIESELFGYEGGAFTGAKREGSPGLFELAAGGTLFLDEVGELPFSFQTKFLRAIQEREIKRVGGTTPIQLNFRLIAATNRNLEEMVREKQFRSDLYYRLNVVPLYIPPLRERRESIVTFVYTFLEHYNRKFSRRVQISPEALEFLEDYHWPGNVRELENTIERLVVLTIGDVVEPNDLPRDIRRPPVHASSGRVTVMDIMSLEQATDEMERQLLDRTYKAFPSTRKVARILGISQSQASRKLSKHKIYDASAG